MCILSLHLGNEWFDRLSGELKNCIQCPGRDFSFRGSMCEWKLVGVVLLYAYSLIVPSSISKIIPRDILSVWLVRSNPHTTANGSMQNQWGIWDITNSDLQVLISEKFPLQTCSFFFATVRVIFLSAFISTEPWP